MPCYCHAKALKRYEYNGKKVFWYFIPSGSLVKNLTIFCPRMAVRIMTQCLLGNAQSRAVVPLMLLRKALTAHISCHMQHYIPPTTHNSPRQILIFLNCFYLRLFSHSFPVLSIFIAVWSFSTHWVSCSVAKNLPFFKAHPCVLSL